MSTVLPIDDDDKKPKIPDGGWGWMVVLSSLIISLIQDGIAFSFGILYAEFIKEFNESKASTAWIGSLFLSVPLLTGPVMSALVDKYGCRAMTITGSLISSFGFFLSFFANGVVLLYFTFGIISGMGLGLTYITVVVSIAFWFDKRRNLAVGLGAAGTGIGTFVYAPFTTMLLEEYGWRWTVVLLGGTLLNMCVCGALMRDPDWIKEQNAKLTSKAVSESTISTDKIELETIRNMLKNGQDAEYILQNLVTSIDEERQMEYQSVLNLPTFIKQNETVPSEVLEQLQENKKLYRVIIENYPSLIHCRSSSQKDLTKDGAVVRVPVTFAMKLKKQDKAKILKQSSLPESANEPLIKPTLSKLVKQLSSTTPHPNYFRNMRVHRHSIHRGSIPRNKYKLRASSCPNIYRVSLTSLHQENEEWYFILVKYMGLFDEFHFFLNSVSTVLLFASFMTPYFYLVDYMLSLGYTNDEASYVLSTIGVTNTIGMVVLGWAGDQPWANVIKICGVCLILCGACCSGLYVFVEYYIVLHFIGALYGIFLASSFSFTPMILVEMLPLETFTKAYGLTLMCQGIGHLGGPPFAAMLSDLTRTWRHSFHVSAVWLVISGALLLIVPYTTNKKMFGSGPVEKELSEQE